jgi:hypothetical protein
MATPPAFRPLRPFRRVRPVTVARPDAVPDLGPLTNLAGTWTGGGFNLVARPDHQGGRPFLLELNRTRERLHFSKIGSPVPDRGAPDQAVFLGLHYLQQISDAVTHGTLHVEPGIWINVPATDEPRADASLVRMATIPHGDSLLAQGRSFTLDGAPRIDVISSAPLKPGTNDPVTLPAYRDQYVSTPLPAGIPAGSTANPNLVLTDAITDQTILNTTVLTIATAPDGADESIPSANNAPRMETTFWIEEVEHPDGFGTYRQLQYTQTVLVRFLGIDWPHITVATLTRTW